MGMATADVRVWTPRRMYPLRAPGNQLRQIQTDCANLDHEEQFRRGALSLLLQSHAGAAAVFIDEHDTRFLKRALSGRKVIRFSRGHAFGALPTLQRGHRNICSFR